MSRLAAPVRRRRPLARLLLALPLLLGAAPPQPEPVAVPAPAVAVPAVARPERDPDIARTYAAAATAVRRRQCAAADQALAPFLARPKAETTFARLVSGLYANACNQAGLAEERLFAAADPGGVLEDWRLLLLSDNAAARGHVLLAQAALAKLLGDHPGSPLGPRALVKAASLAWSQRNAGRAFEMIERGRDWKVSGEPAAQLEGLAWEIASATGDHAKQMEAARRLLVQAPAQAASLHVADSFRAPGGGLDWSDLLSAAELKSRAESLLALDLGTNALAALEAVRARDRDVDWYVLKADILTRDHLGLEALTLLAPLSSNDLREQARLEWARGRAAIDVATAHRGRANLSAVDRRSFQQISVQHLRKVIELAAQPELSAKALRALYAGFAESELFDRAIATLKQLRHLDPADTTGAANLWALGWREYSRRNWSGAVGYWTELADLYPEDGSARRGRYWTARAFEALGETARAQEIYGELAAADTADFYRRSALGRIKGSAAPLRVAVDPRAARPAELWPNDPVLERARLLSDLGLDDLAFAELELVKAKAQPRALSALNALALARRGERRKSMLAIRAAFPALGSPYQAGLPRDALRLYYPLDYQEPVRNWASRNRLPTFLVYGIVRQESAFDPGVTSVAGARGLMQLMPGTARELAHRFGVPFTPERLTDPSYNLQLGTTYFRQVMSMFDDNLELALAGYNGGPYRIKRLWHERGGELDRFLEGLDLEESKTYVKRILVLSDSYRQIYPQAG